MLGVYLIGVKGMENEMYIKDKIISNRFQLQQINAKLKEHWTRINNLERQKDILERDNFTLAEKLRRD